MAMKAFLACRADAGASSEASSAAAAVFQALANAALQDAAAGALDDEAEVRPAHLLHAEHTKP